MISPLRLAALMVCAVSVAACGIEFRSDPVTDEFFTSLKVSGDMRVGQPLTVAVGYQQNYAVIVEITCELREGKELVKEIGKGRAPEYPNANPDTTPFPGNFSLNFTVDEPGDYKVECYTPADEDNYVFDEITVGEGPAEAGAEGGG